MLPPKRRARSLKEDNRKLLAENRKLTYLMLCILHEAGGPIALPLDTKPVGKGIRVSVDETGAPVIEAVQ